MFREGVFWGEGFLFVQDLFGEGLEDLAGTGQATGGRGGLGGLLFFHEAEQLGVFLTAVGFNMGLQIDNA